VRARSEPTCILDDDPSVRDSIEQLLDSDELRAQGFEDAEDFLAHAGREAFLSLVR
jgi:FixJ family two-component response regulator